MEKARSAPVVGTFSCENEREGFLSYYESASGLIFKFTTVRELKNANKRKETNLFRKETSQSRL